MRTERIYIMAHPDEERFYTLPRRPSKEHATNLQRLGYTIFTTTVTFPPAFDTATTAVDSTPLTEQWDMDDDEDEEPTDNDEA